MARRGSTVDEGLKGTWQAADRPLYARVLRLRRMRLSHVMSAVLLEGMLAFAALLSLAALVSWWSVILLPMSVAALVKLCDVVTRTPRATTRLREVARGVAHVAMPVPQLRTSDADASVEPFRWTRRIVNERPY